MNSTIFEGKRYKSLEEIFLEIKNQANKYNNDSYGGIGASFVNGLKNIHVEKRDIVKLLGNSDKKDVSFAFRKNYLNKLNEEISKKNSNY